MNKPRFAFADTMQNTSLCFALRASLRLSKFDPVEFLEQKSNTALERVNNLTHKMPGAFCTAKAPAGAMPWMASSESILAKAFKGELTAHWRAANPDLISGENSAEALLKKLNPNAKQPPQIKRQKKMPSAMPTRVYNANTLRRLEEAKPTSDSSSSTMSEVATLFQPTKIKSEREAAATNKNARQYFRPARPAHRVSAKNGANDSISGDERHNIHHNHFAREQTLGQRTDVQSSFNRMGSSIPKSILYTARFKGHP